MPGHTYDDRNGIRDDLAEFDGAYETAEPPETYDVIPDGQYQVTIERVELTRARKSGTPFLSWKLRIVGPVANGKVLYRSNMIATEDNLRWLKKDLLAAGLQLERLSDLPDRLEELLDVRLLVDARTRGDYQNVYIRERLISDRPVSRQPVGGPGREESTRSGKPRQVTTKPAPAPTPRDEVPF